MVKILYLVLLMTSIYSQTEDTFRVAINNDRDEVFDELNVVYQINKYLESSLRDSKIITYIKDKKNNVVYTHKDITPKSLLFTISIDITTLNLKNNNFYKVEGIFKRNNREYKSSYTFKKIEEIQRKVRFDTHGRMYLNNKLFFPFGIYTNHTYDIYLKEINKTHLNFILPYIQVERHYLDEIEKEYNGRIKVLYNVKSMYSWVKGDCIDPNETVNYIKFLDKINEMKTQPIFIGWYINDEYDPCRYKYTLNKTRTIHKKDPDHPTFSVLDKAYKVIPFMNSTDIMGFDVYPIGTPIDKQPKIRDVYDRLSNQYNIMMEAKPMWGVIQIFDWSRESDKAIKERYPTLQEMRSMTWQALVAGAKGIIFYSLHSLFKDNNKKRFNERWKEIITFTDEIWKYKDVILSITKVEPITYTKKNTVALRQWKYNNENYIAIVNLEEKSEVFKIDLFKNSKVSKELGIGTFTQSYNRITVNLKPIDVFLLKY